MPVLKSFLLTFAAATALLLAAPSSALAAQPCWKSLLSEWLSGRIVNTYPVYCYAQAIQHIPPDLQAYSHARDDINRAMMAALRAAQGPGGPPTGGTGLPSTPDAGGATGANTYVNPGTAGPKKQHGLLRALFGWAAPKSADSVPTPLLVLAALALLLLAAAAASFTAKRIQARRVQLPPPPSLEKPS